MSEKSTTKITRPHLSHALSVNQLCWFIVVILLAHVIEELPRFPEWATRHFGTTTTGFFILSHIPLLGGAFFIVYRSSRDQKNGIWINLAVLVQWALFVNGLFHIATTVAFGEYSPWRSDGFGSLCPFYDLSLEAHYSGGVFDSWASSGFMCRRHCADGIVDRQSVAGYGIYLAMSLLPS